MKTWKTYVPIIIWFSFIKTYSSCKFQYPKDNMILQTVKGWTQMSPVFYRTQTEGTIFAFIGHMKTISTLLVNNLKKPLLLLVNLLIMAKDDSSTAKAQRRCWWAPTWALRRPNWNISVLSYCQELAYQSLCKMQISNDDFSKCCVMTGWNRRVTCAE